MPGKVFMKAIIGIDVGGSTTKIVGFREDVMISPQFVQATDPLTSLYGAFGKFTSENGIELSGIEKVILTGVGSSYVTKPLYGLVCENANEFECVGRGGLFLSGLSEAIVISMGTGTAVVHARRDGYMNYLGGTGVGGGVIVGGRVISGAHGCGGEIGHMCINTHETEYCNCGKRGCLEQYASATGIVRMAKKALAESDEDTVLRKADSLTAKDVMDAARFGDAFALKLLKDFARRLGRGLSFISCVTDPDIFVIGGGVSKAGDILVDAVREHFQEFVFSGQKQTKFGLATLGNDAGIYGCAKMIMDTAR